MGPPINKNYDCGNNCKDYILWRPPGRGGGAKSDRGFLGRLAHIVNSRVDHNFDATC